MTGTDDGRRLALDETPEGVAVAVEDRRDGRAVIASRAPATERSWSRVDASSPSRSWPSVAARDEPARRHDAVARAGPCWPLIADHASSERRSVVAALIFVTAVVSATVVVGVTAVIIIGVVRTIVAAVAAVIVIPLVCVVVIGAL